MLMKAYFFKESRLVTTAIVNKRQKESCMEFFKQYLEDESASNLDINFYKFKDIKKYEKDHLLNIQLNSIKVEKLEKKQVEVPVNWLIETDLASHYNNAQIAKILENREALRSFEAVDEESSFEFPNAISQKTKLVDSNVKERILIDTLNPIDTMSL